MYLCLLWARSTLVTTYSGLIGSDLLFWSWEIGNAKILYIQWNDKVSVKGCSKNRWVQKIFSCTKYLCKSTKVFRVKQQDKLSSDCFSSQIALSLPLVPVYISTAFFQFLFCFFLNFCLRFWAVKKMSSDWKGFSLFYLLIKCRFNTIKCHLLPARQPQSFLPSGSEYSRKVSPSAGLQKKNVNSKKKAKCAQFCAPTINNNYLSW